MGGVVKSRRSNITKVVPDEARDVTPAETPTPRPQLAQQAGGRISRSPRCMHTYFPAGDDPKSQEKEDLMSKYEAESNEAVHTTKRKFALSDLEEEKMVLEVCRTMLFRERLKPGVPVSRTELIKNIGKKGVSSMILKLAQTKLFFATGLEMHELRVSASPKDAGILYYVLRSWMPVTLRQQFLEEGQPLQQQQVALKGFYTVVLALIHMDGERTSESSLWRLLGDVGISKHDDEDHPTLGVRVEDALKGMIARRYLNRSKGGGAEPEFTYEWGPNAKSEVTTQQVQNYIQQTVGALPGES